MIRDGSMPPLVSHITTTSAPEPNRKTASCSGLVSFPDQSMMRATSPSFNPGAVTCWCRRRSLVGPGEPEAARTTSSAALPSLIRRTWWRRLIDEAWRRRPAAARAPRLAWPQEMAWAGHLALVISVRLQLASRSLNVCCAGRAAPVLQQRHRLAQPPACTIDSGFARAGWSKQVRSKVSTSPSFSSAAWSCAKQPGHDAGHHQRGAARRRDCAPAAPAASGSDPPPPLSRTLPSCRRSHAAGSHSEPARPRRQRAGRVDRGPHQTEAANAERAVAVFAVIQQGDAEARLRRYRRSDGPAP